MTGPGTSDHSNDKAESMKVLVTGHDGYIGTVLCPLFEEAGHEVHGLDSGLFSGCALGEPSSTPRSTRIDVRDTDAGHYEGFDAVVHLAALSNDPLGDFNAETTYSINHHGTMHVARMAKAAGVPRFLFSSSCSLYGAHGNDYLTESAEFHPVTPYGTSKMLCEQDLAAMADDSFSPTYLRNATAFGYGPRLRGDLVVNNLTGHAFTTGAVYMKSDGSPWRPLVHIEDISRAFLAVAEAPRDLVHDEAFNVGSTTENYQIRDVARIVEEVVPDCKVVLADSAGPDLRNYRVNCDKIREVLPAFEPVWTVRAGVAELLASFIEHDLTIEDLEGSRFRRLKHITALIEDGTLGDDLRWTTAAAVA